EISICTVAVPAVRMVWKATAGAARAISTLPLGPVAVSAVGVSVPEAQDIVAASSGAAARRTSGTRNFALPARSFFKVCASAACRLVRVDADELGFKTWLAYAVGDLPAAFALAVKAPGRLMAPWIHLSAIGPPTCLVAR